MWSKGNVRLPRRGLLVGVVAGVAVGSVVAGGFASASRISSVPARNVAGFARPSGALVSSLAREYPALRALLGRHARAADAAAIPAAVEQSLAAGSSWLPSLVSAPTEQVDAGTGSFWLTTGGGLVCGHVVETATDPTTGRQVQGAPGGCERDSVVADRGLIITTSIGGNYTVWGLVPTGNSTVSVSLPSGDPQTLPVTGGAVYGTFTAAPRGVTFVGPSDSPETVR